MHIDDIELDYREDARSLHALLRVEHGDETAEWLYDNLTVPIGLIAALGLKVREETIIRNPLVLPRSLNEPLVAGDESGGVATTGAEILRGAAELHSGPGFENETILIVCEGDVTAFKEANS